MEICVDHIESALKAVAAGATRLELCSSLLDGGLTPSVGFQIMAKTLITVPLYVMIRPRGGDFTYTSAEIDVMEEDILQAKKNHLDGVVFGILTPEGTIDSAACQRLLQAAVPLPATFHRAFDMVADPYASLQQIVTLGFERIATSGLSETAHKGLGLITELNKLATNRIEIMPACGINEGNLEEILINSKCKSFHGSASGTVQTTMNYKKSQAKMGACESDYNWKSCDMEKAAKMMSIAKTVWGS